MEKKKLINKGINWENVPSEIDIQMLYSFDKMEANKVYKVNAIKAQILIMQGKAKLA